MIDVLHKIVCVYITIYSAFYTSVTCYYYFNRSCAFNRAIWGIKIQLTASMAKKVFEDSIDNFATRESNHFATHALNYGLN